MCHVLYISRLQHRIAGPGALGLLLRLTPSSLTTLKPHHSTLSCLLHPGTGGIVDDTVITRLGPELFYLVTNAANREKDSEYLSTQIEDYSRGYRTGAATVDWEVLEGWGLIALQGPLSASILEPLIVEQDDFDLNTLYFGQSRFLTLQLPQPPSSSAPYGKTSNSPPVLVSRGGYTGEDGFEISVPAEYTLPLARTLLYTAGPQKLRLAGLGARDSLRLEAGMCLYGHDLDDSTTPVEASLSWIIGRDRRTDPNGFLGADVILPQLNDPSLVARKRVGFILEDAGPAAREGASIVDLEDNNNSTIGNITSGSPSPTLGKNIAMGYVRPGFHRQGTQVGIQVRGKTRRAKVVKMPFVQTRYHKAQQDAKVAGDTAGAVAGLESQKRGVGGASEGSHGESPDRGMEHGGHVRGPDGARGDFGEGQGGKGEGADGAGSGGLEHRLPV